jgi:hypothetical protein
MEGRYADPDACVVACRAANKDHVYFDFYQTGSYHNRCFCGIECEVLYADPNSNQYVLEGTSCLSVHSVPNLKADAIPNPKKEFLRSSQLDSPPAMQLILSISLLVFFVVLFISMALYRFFGHHTSHANGNNAATSRPTSLKSASLSSSSNSNISFSTVAKSPSCTNLSVNLPRGVSTVKLLSKTPLSSPVTSKPPSPKSPKILKV